MKALILIFLLMPAILIAASEPIDKHPEWDQDYSKKIREYTTSPQFLNDMVDHLPASDHVPTPQKVLGYISGTPDRLTYAEDVYKYMRALEAASPRVKVFSIGKSEEGREMILVAIADEKTIQNLDQYKEINRKLSDPRKLTDADARALIAQGKPMYYATGAMHSPETGSPEMLMELAYRLAVEETPMIQQIRNNVITLFTPVLEADGRDRMVDLVRWYQANPNSGMPPLIYWGHYVAHDNNRDTMGLALNLTRNILKTYYEWHPQIIHDLHESIPFLYISTGTGPYNAWLDPVAIEEWQRMAFHEVQVLTSKGMPGVWTHGFYDGWAPNYMFWIAHGHNSIGRFYETFGNLVPGTEDRVVRDASQRAWYRPNPPLPQVKWSLRNNVNYQQSGLLLALQYVAENRQHFMDTFWMLGKRSIAKATTEGPAAYVFEANQKRKGQLRDLLQLLQMQGIEIQQADQPFTIKLEWPPKKKEDEEKKDVDEEKKDKKDEKKQPDSAKFSAGSFIIRMDQPYSRLADTLLDTQYVRGEEKVYDDSGWTLGYAKNVDFQRIVNPDVLKVSMRAWDGKMPGSSAKLSGGAIAITNSADTDLTRLRYALADVPFSITEEELKEKKSNLPVGTVLINLEGIDSKKVGDALESTSLGYEVLPAMPFVKTHPLAASRVAILHTWLDTQDEGWFRLAFESLKVPYSYISTQDVAKQNDLRSKYDVILFPPCDASPQDIVNGMPSGPPLPWKKTALTPNLAVDETDDLRPGMGFNGVENVRKFVQDGGLLIVVRNTAEWAVEYGLARWVSIVPTTKLRAAGSLLQAHVTDKSSPIVSGYDEKIPVHFQGSPVFKVGVSFDTSDRDAQKPEQRPSGRGTQSDPDVPQGRSFVETPEKPKPGPGEQGFQLPEDLPYFYKPFLPKIEERPRVILSFPKEADKILLSGMLEGADEIAGKPLVIDSPLGKGHIVLFANNPMWRQNTQGDYALVFNAIFNYQNLNYGWPPKQENKKDTK